MTTYPIQIRPTRDYRGDGRNAQVAQARDEQNARNIAAYINSEMEKEPRDRPSRIFMFDAIANAVGLKPEEVQSYLYRHGGSSHNAIEVFYPDGPDPT